MFPLSLNAPVGFGHDNDEDDVRATATNLSWLGYPEAAAAADSGQWDNGADEGSRQYQRDRGLTVDGWAGPGGKTEHALNGDHPRESGEADSESVADTFVRLPDRLLPTAPGRAQPSSSLLDFDAPPRANPFAAARAGRSWRGLFRSSRGTIVGGPQGFPPELASRLASIKNPSARDAVERLLRGSVAEKGAGRHPHADYNLYKPGNTSTSMREFRQTVVRMGGRTDMIRFEGPGKWSYSGVDGTRLFYRRAIEGKKATNEIHIDRAGDKPANIKIRYDD